MYRGTARPTRAPDGAICSDAASRERDSASRHGRGDSVSRLRLDFCDGLLWSADPYENIVTSAPEDNRPR